MCQTYSGEWSRVLQGEFAPILGRGMGNSEAGKRKKGRSQQEEELKAHT